MQPAGDMKCDGGSRR